MAPELVKPWVLGWTLIFALGMLVPAAGRWLRQRHAQDWTTNLALLLALLGSLVAMAGALAVLAGGDSRPALPVQLGEILTPIWHRGYLPPVILEIKVDSLAAGFAFLIAGFAAVVAVYSLDGLRAPYFHRQRCWIAGAFNLFVWATLMVVIVNDLFSLLVVLEIMTLAFAGLVLYKHDFYQAQAEQDHRPSDEQRREARLAPQVYLVVSHTSTIFLTIAVLLLVRHTGSFSFDDLPGVALDADAASSTLIFLLALAGLGIRAGLVPAHFWAPLVHPYSPTTTHAFSLGVAIKVAVYLMIRFFFQFLTPQMWWGYLLLGLAVATAIVNVWFAIASHDLKKALAYHSIENIGIIVAAIGAALIYHTAGITSLAVLALVAAFYHLLNHAVFKGLLYLGTGAIERQADQVVDLEHLGGLLRIWRWTGLTFLIGAVSIAGFPPFNGFIGEWLTLQALLGGLSHRAELAPPGGAIALIVGVVGLIASFALTAFCFVKIAGLVLLGAPRAEPTIVAEWRKRADVPWFMRGAMVLLAGLCLLLGLFPARIAYQLGQIAGDVLGKPQAGALNPFAGIVIPGPQGMSQHLPGMLSIFIVACALGFLALLASKARLRGKSKTLVSAPWACGAVYTAPAMQSTGASLSFLIRDLFGAGWGPGNGKAPRRYLPDEFVMSMGAVPGTRQVVVETFCAAYNRSIDWLLRNSRRVEMAFQNGDLRRYLLYILIANVLAMLLFVLLTGW